MVKKILDFGSGAGYLALELKNDNFNILTTDVLDYRVKEAFNIPFIKMISPIVIPFSDNFFDVVIAKTVFHHIDKQNMPLIIKELKRLTKRLIIEEDVFDIPPAFPGLNKLRLSQPKLNTFLSFNEGDQLASLTLMDYFANAVAFGKLNINFPFAFRSLLDWQILLEKNGFYIEKIILSGFETGKVHQNCQAWFICDNLAA
jgi:SAM-dependent methyltransferase